MANHYQAENRHSDIDLTEVEAFLDSIGAKYRTGSRYILTTCPMPDHEDKNASAQIYLDDFFLNCHGQCGRKSPYEYMPNLRDRHSFNYNEKSQNRTSQKGIRGIWNASQKDAQIQSQSFTQRLVNFLISDIAYHVKENRLNSDGEKNIQMEGLITRAIYGLEATTAVALSQRTDRQWKKSLAESLHKANPSITSTEYGTIIDQRILNFGLEASDMDSGRQKSSARTAVNLISKRKLKVNLMEQWKQLNPLPDGVFKTMHTDHLNDLGWRVNQPHVTGIRGEGWFIPYFGANRRMVPFAQVRHHTGERRFTFLSGAEPTMYGLWNLDNPILFIVEGPSDGAVLDYCSTPWVAVPSSSSGELLGRFAGYAEKQGIRLVYAGDNDEAGDKLREALDKSGTGYRICQPPKKYNDWGDYLEACGLEEVSEYAGKEL